MSSEGSVSAWLGLLQAGDHQGAARLWERYFQSLVQLARAKLKDAPRRAADEEDVALSAFASFCHGAENGRFPDLGDRDSLWRLLVVITARKASNLKRYGGRQKRVGSQTGFWEPGVRRLDKPAFDQGSPPVQFPPGNEDIDLNQVLSQEPTPEFAAQMADDYEHLLNCLGDDELMSVALWKMEAYTNDEIAAKLNCNPRSVRRKLRIIRSIWSGEAGLEENPEH